MGNRIWCRTAITVAAFAFLSLGTGGRPARAAPPVEGLAAFKSTLLPAVQTHVDLRRYQTPVKNQRESGNCYTFALVGAIEAAYKRRCLDHPGLAATEPYCARQLAPQGADLDLSEWQLINDMSSQSSTRNPATTHEALGAVCGFSEYALNAGATWATHDAVIVAARGIRIAEEADSPWRSGAFNQALVANAMGEQQHAGVNYPPDYCFPDPPLRDLNPRYDRFNYDPLSVSYDARYGALYGVTAVQGLPVSDLKVPGNLERYLANRYEVDVSINLNMLYCRAYWASPGDTFCSTSAVRNDLGDSGHVLVLVGYDRTRRHFLFKNSWGGDNRPYIWMTYGDVSARIIDVGFIIRGVRPAPASAASREHGYLGTWVVFSKEGNYRGKIAIHRTREMPDGFADYSHAMRGPYVTEDLRLKRLTRLGTFVTATHYRRKVYGQLNAGGRLRLYVKSFPSGVTGIGGDALGTLYSGGTFWGTMVLTSADAARDGLNQTYVRDFSGRVDSTWRGTWDLTLGGGSTTVLTVQPKGTIPTVEGRFPVKGVYLEPTSRAVTGYADERGRHLRLEFERFVSPVRPPSHCVLDLWHQRLVNSGQVQDRLIHQVSRLACDGASGVQVSGLKRLE